MTQQRLYRKERSLTRAFTLAEIVVAAAVVGLIGVVISKFQSDVFSFNRTFSSSFATADNAQKLLRPMTAEIRSASPSSNGSFPIDTIGQYDFAFYSDINNDGKKDWVRYYVSGTTMYKEVIAPVGTTPAVYSQANKITTTFMTGVRNVTDGVPVFRYFSSSYTGGSGGEITPSSGAIESVRLIKVSITLDDNTNKLPIALSVSTQVTIRNLKQQ